VENNLHWVLDVQFHEDQSRVHAGHAAENLARARRIALNLLKREKTCRKGIATKRLKAGWDHQYLLKVLQM
jgi:predicted transposase YbfD/YdcC